MPEQAGTRAKPCDCPKCKWDAHIRGVLRRGDKKEMRATIRELHDTCTRLGNDVEDMHEMLHDMTHGDDEEPKKAVTIN